MLWCFGFSKKITLLSSSGTWAMDKNYAVKLVRVNESCKHSIVQKEFGKSELQV